MDAASLGAAPAGVGSRWKPQPLKHDVDDLSVFPEWEEEDLFARDFEGRLIRMDKATEADLQETIKITVDGHEIDFVKAACRRHLTSKGTFAGISAVV